MIEVGTLIDEKYRILTVIGYGGMSTVYLAMNERANKQWAIKEIRTDRDINAVRKSILNEVEILKKLNHPYLPSIIDVIDYEDSILIVMDYVQGNTLLQLLREYGRFSVEQVVNWCCQLCDVLGYLHSREPAVIYRDVKPGNIMLRPDGTIALIDFGIAREYKSENTEDTICLGTMGYAAPEQFGGNGQTDARTDIYCLGMTAWHLLTGISPNEAECNIAEICNIREDVSDGLASVILKCTQRNPRMRYSDCKELLYDLKNYKKLDESYRRKQTNNLIVWNLCTLVTLVLFVGAIVCSYRYRYLSQREYEDAIIDAGNQLSSMDSVELYKKAIVINPSDSEAYLQLVDDLLIDDDILSYEEDEMLRTLLITDVSGMTCEEHLKKNGSGYADFAYKLGVAYFYCYEDSGNRKLAAKWLKIAAESSIQSQKQYRASILYNLCRYSEVGISNKAGDSILNYSELWNDLCNLCSGDIATEDNITTELIVYRDTLNRIIVHADAFQKANVSQQEIDSLIDSIESKIILDIAPYSSNEDARITELYNQCIDNVGLARDASKNAFKE